MNFVVVRCLLAAVLTALALPTQARVLEDCTTSSPGVPPPAIQDMSPAKRDARRSRARAAAGDVALTDEALAAYAALGLNTVFLDDTLGADVSDPLNLHWVHKSRERLAEELAICRKHNMSVILSLMTTDMPARWVRHYQPGVASPEPPRRTFGSARRRSVTSEPMVPGADEATIAARASLWAELDRGEIIYAFFVPDDVCLVQEPVEKQRRTYEIVKAHAPEIYVLGIMAEYTAFADEDLLRRCWDVRVADDWAMVDYPYDSSGLWTKQLNHLTSQEPDADHVAYQMLLVQMLSHCLKGATPDRQIAEAQRIILVPQVFYIEGRKPECGRALARSSHSQSLTSRASRGTTSRSTRASRTASSARRTSAPTTRLSSSSTSGAWGSANAGFSTSPATPKPSRPRVSTSGYSVGGSPPAVRAFRSEGRVQVFGGYLDTLLG